MGMAIQFAVITASDRSAQGLRPDESGPRVREILEKNLRARCLALEVVPDEEEKIREALVRLSALDGCHLVLTTGGTGLAPRDRTPEATLAVIDRQVPGIAEAIRARGAAVTPKAMLSRAVCGLRGQTLIVNLSGSPRAVAEQLDVLIPVLGHAIEVASGRPQDCGRHPGTTPET